MGFMPALSSMRRGGLVPPLLGDHFAGVSGTLLTAHAMDFGPGWSLLAGVAADCTLQSGRARLGVGQADLVVADSGKADVAGTLTVRFPTADAGNGLGLVLRASDASNFWLGWLTGAGQLVLYDCIAGAFSIRANSAPAVVAGHDYALFFEAYRDHFWLSLDGAAALTWTSVFNQTAKKHGMRAYSGDGSMPLADDFQVVKSAYKTLSIIGDSIGLGFPAGLAVAWNAGNNLLVNHSVGGNSVEVNMANQVLGAAGDDADLIVSELGSNDGTPTQYTTYHQGLLDLKASNTRARIVGMSVLDRVGVSDADRLLKCAWIQAACADAGVQYLDMTGAIVAASADTSDGTHPSAQGQTKIVARIMSLI